MTTNIIYSTMNSAKGQDWVSTLVAWAWINSAAVNLELLTTLLHTNHIADSNIVPTLEAYSKEWEDASSTGWNAGTMHFGFMEPNYTYEKALKIYLGVVESLTTLMDHTEMYPTEIRDVLKKELQEAIIYTPWETVITKSQKINIQQNILKDWKNTEKNVQVNQVKWLKELWTKKMNSEFFNPFENIRFEEVLPWNSVYDETEKKYKLINEHPLASWADFWKITKALFKANNSLSGYYQNNDEKILNKIDFQFLTNSKISKIKKHIDKKEWKEYFIVTYIDKNWDKKYVKAKSIFWWVGWHSLKLLQEVWWNTDNDWITPVGWIFLNVKFRWEEIWKSFWLLKKIYEDAIKEISENNIYLEYDSNIEELKNKIIKINNLEKKFNSKWEIRENEKKWFNEIMDEFIKIFHFAKDYAPAWVDSPPMSVPHLDYRKIKIDWKDYFEPTLVFWPHAITKVNDWRTYPDLFFKTIDHWNVLNFPKNAWEKVKLTKYLAKEAFKVLKSEFKKWENTELNPKNKNNNKLLEDIFKFSPVLKNFYKMGIISITVSEWWVRCQIIWTDWKLMLWTKVSQIWGYKKNTLDLLWKKEEIDNFIKDIYQKSGFIETIKTWIDSKEKLWKNAIEVLKYTKAYYATILWASPWASISFTNVLEIVENLLIENLSINSIINFLNEIISYKSIIINQKVEYKSDDGEEVYIVDRIKFIDSRLKIDLKKENTKSKNSELKNLDIIEIINKNNLKFILNKNKVRNSNLEQINNLFAIANKNIKKPWLYQETKKYNFKTEQIQTATEKNWIKMFKLEDSGFKKNYLKRRKYIKSPNTHKNQIEKLVLWYWFKTEKEYSEYIKSIDDRRLKNEQIWILTFYKELKEELYNNSNIKLKLENKEYEISSLVENWDIILGNNINTSLEDIFNKKYNIQLRWSDKLNSTFLFTKNAILKNNKIFPEIDFSLEIKKTEK